MAPPLLSLQDIGLTLGGAPLLEGVDLAVGPRERLCLVGRNGSGKSTLLRLAAGEIEPDRGSRFLQPDATVRYLPQEPSLAGFTTVLAYVEAGLSPGDDQSRARSLLDRLGLSGAESPDQLSGGEARRAALARALAPQPDLLMLDEPTNHLDLVAIEWLEAELIALRSALVVISHDRRFLAALSQSVIWLDRGRTRRLDRGFGDFELWRDEILEEEERENRKLDRKMAEEEHWVRYGVTARRKRNLRRMSQLADLRRAKREARRVLGHVKLSVSEAKISGALVVEAERVSKAFEGRPIVADFSMRIMRGDRLGLVGANGVGKTTLLKLLTGVLAPESGHVRRGANVAIATLDQGRASLTPDLTLSDALTGGGGDWVEINGRRKHVIGYMKDFLFEPGQARTPVSRLSGGERGRLLLARALSLPSNLVVLDEPTNDLDLETLDLMQEMLTDYPGTVILVSHDRDFLDRVATSILVAEGLGRWTEYAGGYSDMVAQRGFGVGGAPIRPAKQPRPTPVAAPQTNGAPPQKKRLSFKQKHAMETLHKMINDLGLAKARMQAALDDPALYNRDPERFGVLSAAFAKTEADLAAAEEEWLELEIMREALGE